MKLMRNQNLKFETAAARHTRAGFTLIEIIITMALMAIVGAIGVTSAVKIIPGMRMDRASSRLAFQLQLARSEAIANNQNIFIDLNSTANTLTIWADTNRDGVRDAGEVSTILLEDPRLVTIQTTLTAGLFNAYGQFITTPGQRRMETTVVRISPVGSLRSVDLTLRGSGAITKR